MITVQWSGLPELSGRVFSEDKIQGHHFTYLGRPYSFNFKVGGLLYNHKEPPGPTLSSS